jgi:SAM-dependent methyltransferase
MEREFWVEKYQKLEIGWNIGTVSRPIKEYIDQLTNKNLKILIPGCGYAHEATYLFSLGFNNVFILDFSEEALRTFSKQNESFPSENLICEDFFQFHMEESQKFDIIIEQTLFCAIKIEMRDLYVQKVYDLLKKEGKLVGLLFNREFPDKDNPPFGGSIEEYFIRFSKLFTKVEIKPCYNSIPQRENTEVFIKISK